MKRVLYQLIGLALLFSVLGLSSCDTGSGGGSTPASPFTGTWSYDAMGLAGGSYTFTGSSFTETVYSNFMITFTASGSGTFTYDEGAKTITLTYSSYTNSITGNSIPEPMTYQYLIEGSTLTLTDPEDPEGEGTVYTKQ